MERITGFFPLLGDDIAERIEDHYIINTDNDIDIGINKGLALAARIARGENV